MRRVKFGAFYEYLDRVHGNRFDRVASGHYARLIRGPALGMENTAGGSMADGDGATWLALTADAVKDQTYFLAQLTQVRLNIMSGPNACVCFINSEGMASSAGPWVGKNNGNGRQEGMWRAKWCILLSAQLGVVCILLTVASGDRRRS